MRDLYEKEKVNDKKYRFQPEIVKGYKKRIKILQDAERIEDLMPINALNYKVLEGDKAGISSIRVNKQYRIEFIVTNNGVESIATVCNIIELSNHYK